MINRIRAEDDRFVQVRGRMELRDGILQPVVGTARLYIFPAAEHRTEGVIELRRQLAFDNDDRRHRNTEFRLTG
jgi:DNA helicase-2/ATP-dependent DNA helicase PcrA